MGSASHATATRAPEAAPEKAHGAGDCCAGELQGEAGLPRFLGGIQGKFEVGPPGDAHEREADAVADAVQRRMPVQPIRPATGTPRFQRLCAECAEKLIHSEVKEPGPIQRFSGEPEKATDTGADSVSTLSSPVRSRLEASLGAKLADVRVHTGPAAQALNEILGAKAFARGTDIWLGARQRPDDLGLMAHEVTHVLQQNGGSAGTPGPDAVVEQAETLSESKPDKASGDDGAGDEDAGAANDSSCGAGAGSAAGAPDPSDAPPRDEGLPSPRTQHVSAAFAPAPSVSEHEATHNARAVSLGMPARVATAAPVGIQRDARETLDAALSWGAARVDDAESAVASGAKAVGEFAGEQLMKALRAVAPEVADIIDEGPINYAKRKINEALEAHLPDALGGMSVKEIVDAVTSWIGDAATFVKDLLKGDAKACAAFAALMEKLTNFVTKLIDNPVTKTITSALTKVWDFVGKAVKFVAAPVFDAIAKQVSGAWSALKKVASTVSGWISKAKNALGKLWDELVGTLGFDGSSEDGVWAHIKKVGEDIWEGIKAKMAPVIEPLNKVSSVLALLTPMGQVHAIVKYGPKLVKVAQWVWNNGLDPAKIREAPEEIRGMLTDLTTNVDGFKGVLQTGLDWLAAKFGALADAALDVAGAITGLPLIGFAHTLFDEAKKALKGLVEDIKKGAKDALAAIEAAYTKISDFIAPYKEVIGSLILAIGMPGMIPVIFAGWAWRALPRCVKIPILNFILDIAITALDALPAVPTFGLLWPLLKPAVMAFMGTLRAAEDEVKEQVSDKIAKVISGASPEFVIGFVKGFCVGVWEGITDPFKAIWTVLEGLDTATEYLKSLAGFGDEKKEAKKAPEVATAAPVAAPAGGGEIVSLGRGGGQIARAGGGGKITARSGGEASATAAPVAAPAWGAAGGSGGEISRRAPAPAPVPAPAQTSARGTITAVTAPSPAAAPTPAAANDRPVGDPEAEKEYVANPAAALASGTAMPDATRRLLEKLAAQKAANDEQAAKEAEAEAGGGATEAPAVSEEDLPALKERAGAMAEEIGPDVQTVKGGFWDAVQEYFSGGSMSFDEMVDKLSSAWETAKEKLAEGAAWLANQLIGFFRGSGAEGELGDKIGWLTGTIAFQALLDYISAGTWAAAGPVLKGIAKFINWPMEFLGEAFKLLKTLGKYLLDGLKKLGGAIKDAAAGAFKTVSKALGNIAERLLRFGEEIFGKFAGKAAKAESKVAGTLGKEGAKLESKVSREALGEAEQKAAQKLEQQAAKGEPHAPRESPTTKPEAGEPKAKSGEGTKPEEPKADTPAKREASVEESGKVESPQLTQKQIDAETAFIQDNPHLIVDGPPRQMQVGKHTWTENPGGGWCRHSDGEVCVPKLRVTKGPELTPDNVEEVIADLKSKRVVSPREEERLRAVAETERGIWNLRGPKGKSLSKGGVGLRGEVGHSLLGEDLPYAKIIDSAPRIDPLTGLATEVRSIKTHQLYNFKDEGQLLAQLKTEVNQLASFTTVTSGGTTITAAEGAQRILVIGVPPGQLEATAGASLTAQWRQEAAEAMAYAQEKGVRIVFKTIK